MQQQQQPEQPTASVIKQTLKKEFISIERDPRGSVLFKRISFYG